MKQTKYFCDCCGKEVKNEDDLDTLGIRETNLSKGEDDINLYDVCRECEDKINEAMCKEFHRIKRENNK